jgi:hypothetical protein
LWVNQLSRMIHAAKNSHLKSKPVLIWKRHVGRRA